MVLRPCPCIQDSGEKLRDRFQFFQRDSSREARWLGKYLKQFVPLPSLLIKHNGTCEVRQESRLRLLS